MNALVDGSNNVAVGYVALAHIVSASDNTAVGFAALSNATTGTQNTAVGSAALNNNVAGNYNVAVGYQSLISNTGSQSTAVGTGAASNVTGARNTALGYNALYAVTTGLNNIGLGAYAGSAAGADVADHTLYIGDISQHASDYAINTITIASSVAGGPTITNSIKFGNSVICGIAALLTTATDGFLYIPSCAGPPTGVPSARTGTIPLCFDSTNNFLYVYNSGWKKSTVYA